MQAVVEVFRAQWLRQKLVHASQECLSHERNLCVGREAYNLWLFNSVIRIVLEEFSYGAGHLRPIHIWHAVVEEDNFVHRGFVFDCERVALFNYFKGYEPTRDAITSMTFRLKHEDHHLDVHLLIVNYQNLR